MRAGGTLHPVDARPGPRLLAALTRHPRCTAAAGAQSAAPAAQPPRAWQLEGTGGLRAGGLDQLPNALDAEYWLRRVAAAEAAGDVDGAIDLLRQAQRRDVRPATAIAAALQQLAQRAAASAQGQGVCVCVGGGGGGGRPHTAGTCVLRAARG